MLSSLADLFDEQGDVPQAITQERRALALCEQLPDPATAPSHNNLATYLERSGTPSPSPNPLATGLPPSSTASSPGSGSTSRPRCTTTPSFSAAPTPPARADRAPRGRTPRRSRLRPLDYWLRQRQVDVAEVQAAVDQFLDMARQAAMEQERTRGTSPCHHPQTLTDAPRTARRTRTRRPRRRSRPRHALEQPILQRLAARRRTGRWSAASETDGRTR